MHLTFSPENETTLGPCECCGNMTRRVWGFVYDDSQAIAAYFVEWTIGHVDHAANFDFIIGRWGDDTSSSDRSAVALAYRNVPPAGGEFMVIDAAERSFSENSLVGHVLSRAQVLGSPLRAKAFEICDAICLQDSRIEEIRT